MPRADLSYDELVETMMAVAQLRIADQKRLSEHLSGEPADMAPDPSVADRVMRLVYQRQATNLVLDDRSSPLINERDLEAIMDGLMNEIGDEELEGLSEEEQAEVRLLFRRSTSAIIKGVLERTVTADIDKQYDNAWKQIEAYRTLAAESPSGVVDSNEFVRRTTTPQEWLDAMDKTIAYIEQGFTGTMQQVAETLAAQLDEELDENDRQELYKMVAETMAETMPNLTERIKSWRDQRYIEVWVVQN